MQEAGGMEGEENGEGEKSQKGGQQEDSFPFLITLITIGGRQSWKLTFYFETRPRTTVRNSDVQVCVVWEYNF